jgi:hypothetical protein
VLTHILYVRVFFEKIVDDKQEMKKNKSTKLIKMENGGNGYFEMNVSLVNNSI